MRNRGLGYSVRSENYLRFLADWVELVDFRDQDLAWLRPGGWDEGPDGRQLASWIVADRDVGPLSTRLVTPRAVRWLRRTRVPKSVLAALLRAGDPLAELLLVGGLRRGTPYAVDPQALEYAKPIGGEVVPHTTSGVRKVPPFPASSSTSATAWPIVLPSEEGPSDHTIQ